MLAYLLAEETHKTFPSTGALPTGLGALFTGLGVLPTGRGALPTSLDALPTGLGALPIGLGTPPNGLVDLTSALSFKAKGASPSTYLDPRSAD